MFVMERGIPTTGMLDLEEMPSLHHQQRQQQQLFPFAREFNNSPPLQQQQLRHAAAYGIGGGGGNGSRGKQHPLVLGSEDEHAFADHTAAAAAADAGTKRAAQPSPTAAAAAASPWQRMKWTDGMVRLLIMVVYCIGDDGTGTETADQHQQQPSTGKGKKSQATAAAAGLLLQKKGKWKSVSRAMMEKGFYVSPQQCEDKFNDLNKRYKRVNDLLGKGTACRVVENQSLLDTMDHLSPKAKEEARKLLNSKHLFFREMCAYHNSGGGGGGGAAASCSSSLALSQPLLPSQQALHESQQQCSHHQLNSSHRFTGKRGHEDDIDEDDMHDDRDDDADDDEDADDDYEDEDDDEDDILAHDKKQQRGSRDEDDKEFKAAKKARTSLLMPASSMSASPPLSLSLSASPAAAAAAAAITSTSMQQLKGEMLDSLAAIVGEQQQRHWLRKKAAELEEQRLGYQCQALELERQRFKWLRFSSNKEHEMKRMKLHNERLCLENDRMLLLLHQKEHEITNANCNSSSIPAKIAADHFTCT